MGRRGILAEGVKYDGWFDGMRDSVDDGDRMGHEEKSNGLGYMDEIWWRETWAHAKMWAMDQWDVVGT